MSIVNLSFLNISTNIGGDGWWPFNEEIKSLSYFSNVIGGRSKTDGGWDTHGFDNTRMYPIVESYHLPITDQTLPTLIEDLDQRGMLDETLVVWMGEFGRTPKINKNASRDHWPQCYSVLLAGGGVKKGFVLSPEGIEKGTTCIYKGLAN